MTGNRARIDGAFFLRQGASILGTLDLTATEIGAIDDEEACWPQKGDLLLNRCRYGAFIGGPIDAASRLRWLERQGSKRWEEDFWPQPYEQLATLLRELRSLEWTMCNLRKTDSRYMPSTGLVMPGRASPGRTQLSCFLSQPEASSYPEFNPLMYSLDALLALPRRTAR